MWIPANSITVHFCTYVRTHMREKKVSLSCMNKTAADMKMRSLAQAPREPIYTQGILEMPLTRDQ